MCEFRDWQYKGPAMTYFANASLRELLPPNIRARFPYALQEGCCPVCGRYREYRERIPESRASRSMCREHYESLVAHTITSSCLVCGRTLPDKKIRAQQQNRREVANHIHEGECLYRWAIIHDVAVGDLEVTAVFARHGIQARDYQPFVANAEYGPVDNGHFIEAEFDDPAIKQLPQYPQALPSSRPKALPPPPELARLQQSIGELSDSGAGRSTYKGKAVKHIPLWGRRERS
jgi:hypothetical protein